MTPTSPVTPIDRRGFPLGKLVLGFLAGLALALAFGAGALLAYQGQYADRIYPGVTVDGVDVAGLTREDAAARLEAELARYGAGTATVTIDGEPFAIPYAELGRRADVDRLVALAWTVGHGAGDPLAGAAEGVHSLVDGTEIAPLVLVDPAAVRAVVTRLALAVNRAPVSGSAKLDEAGFVAQPSSAGRVVPRDAIADALVGALGDPAAPDSLQLAFATDPVEPFIDDAEVAAAIAAADRMAQPVVLRRGSETWTLDAETVRGWIRFRTTTGGYAPVVASTAPSKALKALAASIDRDPREASFVFRSGRIAVVAGRNGRTLDVKASAPRVATAVAARVDPAASPEPVALAIKVVEPKLTTAEAKAVAPRMREVSSWTTYYEVSERNGFSANISIPARDLDGVVVAPGETFDFWSRIGPVTVARGYKYGGAIINGRSQPTGAFAGGICSTSTTLFNAVARAGYQMLSRHNHYYYITRYPVGLDATVAIEGGSVTTMSWKNDSKYPVLIRSYAVPGTVRFSIWTVAVNNRPAVGGGARVPGSTNVTYRVANGRTVTISTSPKRNYLNAGAGTQRTASLPAGTVRVAEYPTDGFDVTVTRVVREGGKVLHRNTWYSHYAKVDGLTLIGTGR